MKILGNLRIVLQGLQGTQTDEIVNGAFDDVADPVFVGDTEIGAHFMGDTVDLGRKRLTVDRAAVGHGHY